MKINKEICIGCGACESSYPEIFEIREGKANIKDKNISSSKEYIEICPVEAIKE